MVPIIILAFPEVYNIIHYRAQNYEGTSKDYEFSRRTMEEHWTAGYNETVRNLRHPETLERPTTPDGVLMLRLRAVRPQ